MLNVAVIEDDPVAMENIVKLLDKFGKEKGIDFGKRCYGYATEFLENYSADYDLIFMDIQLPDLDGMSAAKKLRESDASVALVFVTNFAQYAINGYEVNAADFIVKPVEYPHFAAKLERILARINALSDTVLPIKTSEGYVSISVSSLKYVETMGHGLVYHTTHGNYTTYGSLYKVEARLAPLRFVRCNNCYLVNPRYVEAVNNFTAIVGGDELKISYARKKEFRKAIAAYLGGLV